VVNGGIGVEPEAERPIRPGSDRVVNGGIGVEPEAERPIRPGSVRSSKFIALEEPWALHEHGLCADRTTCTGKEHHAHAARLPVSLK
jgi:hypothetical protein